MWFSKECADIISNLLIDIIDSKKDKYRIIERMVNAHVDPLSNIRGEDVNDIIVNSIKDSVKGYINEMSKTAKGVYIQPKGITDKDFLEITKKTESIGFGLNQEKDVPGIVSFLHNMGVEELPAENSLLAMREIECDENTRASVVVQVINRTRFGMNDEIRNNLKKAKLFKFDDGIKTLEEAKPTEILEDKFEGMITDKLTTPADFSMFAKRIGLLPSQLAMNNSIDKSKKGSGEETSKVEHVIKDIVTKTETFSKKNVIKKWRSVEKNVAAVIELMEDVISVNDVSEQNVGYDIEAVLKDGTKRYYEVKSVDDLGETISITNNEYSTGDTYKNSYYLAIATQNDYLIKICFVKNPINALPLQKRITRWEWFCNEYSGETVTAEMI